MIKTSYLGNCMFSSGSAVFQSFEAIITLQRESKLLWIEAVFVRD